MPWELVVKQPSMLEDMAISTLIKWHISPVRKCVYPIRENSQIETTVGNIVSTQTEIGRRYFSAIPNKFHNKLIAEAIRGLSTITEDIWIKSVRHPPLLPPIDPFTKRSKQEREKISKDIEIFNEKKERIKQNLTLQIKLVGQMIETFLNEKVTNLVLSQHHLTLSILSFSKYSLLPSLTSLTINSDYRFRYTQSKEIKTHILEILKESHNLKYLNLVIDEIDEEIISCIVDNCKLIEELDFRFSSVMDSSCHLLADMPNLKTFYVDALNVNCLKTVMLSCERMENVCVEAFFSSDATQNLFTCIHEIASQADNSNKLTKIKSYSGEGITSEQILLLANKCPLIDRLIINAQNEYIDFRALAGYSNLSHLHLQHYSFYENHIKEALNEIGHNLKSLSLVGDNQTDLNALIHISQKCPNLESLIVIACIFNKYVPEYEENKLTIRPFTNLKTLNLDTGKFKRQVDNLIDEVVNFLLSNCSNVEYVDIKYYPHMISTLNTVDVGRLKCLKELKIRVE